MAGKKSFSIPVERTAPIVDQDKLANFLSEDSVLPSIQAVTVKPEKKIIEPVGKNKKFPLDLTPNLISKIEATYARTAFKSKAAMMLSFIEDGCNRILTKN